MAPRTSAREVETQQANWPSSAHCPRICSSNWHGKKPQETLRGGSPQRNKKSCGSYTCTHTRRQRAHVEVTQWLALLPFQSKTNNWLSPRVGKAEHLNPGVLTPQSEAKNISWKPQSVQGTLYSVAPSLVQMLGSTNQAEGEEREKP